MSIKDITVVITSFRSSEKIKSCLNAIDRQCRILLVENSDDFEFKKKMEKEFANVECIITGANLGYGKGNNIGLKKVTTKYALILNPDATLHPSTLVNFLKTVDEIPEFAIMGPYLQGKKNNDEKNDLKESAPIATVNVKGFAMFLNLSEFKDIGFFDEDFFIYFEEIDLCKRLIDNGKKIYLVPNIVIDHEGSKSHEKALSEEIELTRNWHWMWSTFNYHRKHKGYFISFLIAFPKFISAIFKVLFYTFFVNKRKKAIYYQRYSGLINAILGKSSWYRPNV